MNVFRQIASVSGMNLQSIPRRLGSSLVIVMGIAGVVVVLLSFLAMAKGLTETIANSGHDDRAVVLRRGADSEGSSSMTLDATRSIETAAGIRRNANGEAIASPEVLTVVALANKGDGANGEVTVRGVRPVGFELRPEIKLVAGRLIEPGRHEVMAGSGAQAEFNGLELGDKVAIRNSEWTVVGIFESRGDTRESELLVDAESLLSVQQSSIYNSVTVQLESAESFATFKNALNDDPVLTVTVVKEKDYYGRQSTRLNTVLTIVAYLVGGIMAIGAMFGALSTMYSAVSTRTQEIATLRAIGFGPTGVVASVMLESLLLAGLGGLTGGGLAWLFFNGRHITTFLGRGHLVAQLQVSGSLLGIAILWACAIGLAGGLFPAIRAARLPVATALRAT